jgi:hypothetical protein
MSKARPRSKRTWPFVVVAGLLGLALACSLQFAGQWHSNAWLYLSYGNGSLSCWLWSPGERWTLGLGDHTTPYGPGTFFWCDPWGYGVGAPMWPIALLAAALAVWRYAVSASRRSPPPTRRARWRVTLWFILSAASVLGLVASARHREGSLLTIGGNDLRLENGSLVFVHRPLPFSVGAATTSRAMPLRLRSPQTPMRWRQGSQFMDFIPDLYADATGWRAAVPFWPLAVLFGWLTRRALKSAAFKGAGLCHACGYSMSGLAPGTNCPECGISAHPEPTAQHAGVK